MVANIGGVIMAAVAALPGIIGWALGIPAGSPAKSHGLNYMVLNVIALVLFIINAEAHASQWSATHPDKAGGLDLAVMGVLCTIGAGFFGWTMIQDDHVDTSFNHELGQRDHAGRGPAT